MAGLVKCFISLLLAGLLLSGCAATRLVSSWHDPSLPTGGAAKLLVIALAQQDLLRHKIEDEYVRQLAEVGIDAKQSYRIFPNEKQIVPETVKAKLPEIGRDSVLVTHFVDVKTETVYVPPTIERYPTGPWYSGGNRPYYYNNFGSYYNHSYAIVSRPGYTYDYKIYVVETNLYAASDKMLWTAITESEESDSLDAAIQDFVEVVTADMKKNGLF
jgi:hypothetical protein